MREKVISDLIQDKLLIEGKWFNAKNINGVADFIGYMKGYSGNDTKSQVEFAASLAKYAIDYTEFEKSFKRNKVGDFPRTLDLSDINQSRWLFSQALQETILSNNFLKERLVIHPSALMQSSNSK